MRKRWSKHWVRSTSRRKQRLYRLNAPQHIRRRFMRAMLSKSLNEKFNINSLGVRKGDNVKIMRGEFRGISGEVVKVDYKKLKIYIDSVKRKKSSGNEYLVPIDPSNVMITQLNLDDERRLGEILADITKKKEELKERKGEEELKEILEFEKWKELKILDKNSKYIFQFLENSADEARRKKSQDIFLNVLGEMIEEEKRNNARKGVLEKLEKLRKEMMK